MIMPIVMLSNAIYTLCIRTPRLFTKFVLGFENNIHFITVSCVKIAGGVPKSEDPDLTPCFVVSDQVLHCLLRLSVRLIRANTVQ